MPKYKVSVYAIAKNEEKFAERWVESVKEADEICVLDTGSTDNTAKILKKLGVKVKTQIISPWRFDVARNLAMDMTSKKANICVSNDLDEVFEKGWRKKLEAAWDKTATRGRYLFVCSHNPDGTPAKSYSMEKIHLRHGFRWVHPVHEVLEYSGDKPDKTVWLEGVVLHHYPDLSKPRTQYLPLLELSAAENPEDHSVIFWLGREYMYYGKYSEAIATLKRHLTLKDTTWDEERSASKRFISKCYYELGDKAQAKKWIWGAIAECPHIREPYLALCKMAYADKDWQTLLFAALEGLKVKQRTFSYLLEEEAWGYILYDYASIAFYYLGSYKNALIYAQTAYNMSPDNQRLKNNLEICQKTVAQKGSRA